MSILFTTVAVVCTMSACSDYVIDTATNEDDAASHTSQHNDDYQRVWQDEQELTDWLGKYQIGETVFEIVSIDIESQTIPESDIP